MTAVREETPPALDKALRRIEELTSVLYQVAEGGGREAARELLEVVLDLHGLGLARIAAIVAAAENGSELTRRVVADPYARAVLLLHGLHPLNAEERLREAIAYMEPQWRERGFMVDLVSAGAVAAHVRIHKNGSGEPAEQLEREVESILVDAAPDLDDIVIEIGDRPGQWQNGQEQGRRIEA